MPALQCRALACTHPPSPLALQPSPPHAAIYRLHATPGDVALAVTPLLACVPLVLVLTAAWPALYVRHRQPIAAALKVWTAFVASLLPHRHSGILAVAYASNAAEGSPLAMVARAGVGLTAQLVMHALGRSKCRRVGGGGMAEGCRRCAPAAEGPAAAVAVPDGSARCGCAAPCLLRLSWRATLPCFPCRPADHGGMADLQPRVCGRRSDEEHHALLRVLPRGRAAPGVEHPRRRLGGVAAGRHGPEPPLPGVREWNADWGEAGRAGGGAARVPWVPQPAASSCSRRVPAHLAVPPDQLHTHCNPTITCPPGGLRGSGAGWPPGRVAATHGLRRQAPAAAACDDRPVCAQRHPAVHAVLRLACRVSRGFAAAGQQHL